MGYGWGVGGHLWGARGGLGGAGGMWGTWVMGPEGGVWIRPATPLPPPVVPAESRLSPQRRHVPPSARVTGAAETPTARSVAICPSVCVGRVRSLPPPPQTPLLSDAKQRWGRRWLLGGRFHPLSPAPFCLFRGENKRGVYKRRPHNPQQEGGGRRERPPPPRLGIRSLTAAGSTRWGGGLRFPWGVGGHVGLQGQQGAPGPVIASSPGCGGMAVRGWGGGGSAF